MVIAEIGTAHGGNFEKAKKMIQSAKKSGADGVKFQWVYANEILHPKTGLVNLPGGQVALYEKFLSLEVPPEFFVQCRKECKNLGLKFICSAFGLKSLFELAEIEPDAIKIASPEINHFPLLKSLADIRKNSRLNGKPEMPVIISTGVSKMRDIENAIKILGTNKVTVLHCVTSYPAPEKEYNLRTLETIQKRFGVFVGVSDHSLDPVLVPCLSFVCGAQIVEKHITLNKDDGGLDDKIALNPEEFFVMTRALKQCNEIKKQFPKNWKEKIIFQLEGEFGKKLVQKTLGNGKKILAKSERKNYGYTNRSLRFVKSLKKGQKIQEGDVAILRSEKNLDVGISPKYFDAIIGKPVKKNCESGDAVNFFNVRF